MAKSLYLLSKRQRQQLINKEITFYKQQWSPTLSCERNVKCNDNTNVDFSEHNSDLYCFNNLIHRTDDNINDDNINGICIMTENLNEKFDLNDISLEKLEIDNILVNDVDKENIFF